MKSTILKCLQIIIIVIVPAIPSFSQDLSPDNVKDKLPKIQSASNMGTDFWFTVPPGFESDGGGDYLINIYVSSQDSTLVIVEVPSKKTFMVDTTIPNGLINFRLTPITACPWCKSGPSPSPKEQVWSGAGIHVLSFKPVIVYCVLRYPVTSDGFLVLPTSSLGKDYIVSSYGSMDAWTTAVMPSLSGCCATEDSTNVSFTLGGNTGTITSGGMKPGEVWSKMMQRGDVVMFASKGGGADLSGSSWKADKPVAVVSGNHCANIPIENRWCDYTCEMDQPVFTWGTTYHVPKIHGRKFSSVIRIFASDTNTTIFRDGVEVGKLAVAGGLQNEGWLEMRCVPLPDSAKPVVISSNKPVGVTLYNTGVQEDGEPYPDSDPFQMAILPTDSYLTEMAFACPSVQGGIRFNKNYLDFIYETDENGELPDDVEFGTADNGVFSFSKMKSVYNYPDEKYNYNVNGKKYAMKKIDLPIYGVFRIRASRPFAAYSYGYGYCDSYGFPSGVKPVAAVSSKDSVPPQATYTMDCKGNISDGVVRDMPDSQERSNIGYIMLDKKNSYNYKLVTGSYSFGNTSEIHWSLETVDTNRPSKAVIILTDAANNYSTIELGNKLSKLEFNKDHAHFELDPPQKADSTIIDMQNTGTEPITIQRFELKDGNNHFSIDKPSLPLTLQPGAAYSFKVRFTADASMLMGRFSDSLVIGDDCVNYYSLPMWAYYEKPEISMSDIDFGKVEAGRPSTIPFCLSNFSDYPNTITGFHGNTVPEFSFHKPSFPFTIVPDDNILFYVTFKAGAEGTYLDSIIFESDAGTEIDNAAVLKAECIPPNSIDQEKDLNCKVSILPNPTSGGRATVSIYSDRECGAEITVCNIAGEQLLYWGTYTLQAGENLIEPDLSKLPSGVYYLLVKSCGRAERVKFSIIR